MSDQLNMEEINSELFSCRCAQEDLDLDLEEDKKLNEQLEAKILALSEEGILLGDLKSMWRVGTSLAYRGKDDERSISLLRESASKGYGGSMFILSRHIDLSMDERYAFLKLCDDPQAEISYMAEDLTEEQIALGERLYLEKKQALLDGNVKIISADDIYE